MNLKEVVQELDQAAALNRQVLVEKRQAEITAYASFYQEMLLQFSDYELATAFSEFSGLRQLADGDVLIGLYGRLFGNPNPNANVSGFDGDGTWASWAGEQLIARVSQDGQVKYLHLVQDRKLADLARYYNPQFENSLEPVNYNHLWLWSQEEYQTLQFDPQDPDVAAYLQFTNAVPQILKYRELTPADIAKHPTFARGGLERISLVAGHLLLIRKSLANGYDATTQRLEKIVHALQSPS